MRERGGAPLVLARQHVGLDADVYALTSQNRITTDPHRAERVRIEPVHDAWNVLGHHLRRIYELITHYGLTSKADIYAAAAIPRSTGDTMILDLEVRVSSQDGLGNSTGPKHTRRRQRPSGWGRKPRTDRTLPRVTRDLEGMAGSTRRTTAAYTARRRGTRT